MNTHTKSLFLYLVLILALFIISYFSLSNGLSKIPLFTQNLSDNQSFILFQLRLPRLLLAILIGALLGLCGAVMQGLFRNPLADPAITGVSSGAALGAMCTIILFPTQLFLLPIFSFLGGLIATCLVWKLAKVKQGNSVIMLILAGVAISTFANSIISYLSYLADNTTLRQLYLWQMGSVNHANYSDIVLTACVLICAFVIFWRYSQALNIFILGEAEAKHLGIHVERMKLVLILTCSIAIGICVAFSGIIGFVGLIIPHCVRFLVGSNHHYVLPISMLLGGVFLPLSDLVSRLLIPPAELPLGLITSLIGAPFFIVLLIKQRQKIIASS